MGRTCELSALFAVTKEELTEVIFKLKGYTFAAATTCNLFIHFKPPCLLMSNKYNAALRGAGTQYKSYRTVP
ncbi:hypothetical protein FORC77_1409 [Vibrio vulnificus]|nr:hypothetical protein FORC77_1409 [Vibrio vulnificus]